MKISNFLGVDIPISIQTDYFKIRAYVQGFLRTQGNYPVIDFDINRNEEPCEKETYELGQKDAKRKVQE